MESGIEALREYLRDKEHFANTCGIVIGDYPAFLYKENPALDAGFRERYAFDQKSSKS